jgi:hypothetical protein
MTSRNLLEEMQMRTNTLIGPERMNLVAVSSPQHFGDDSQSNSSVRYDIDRLNLTQKWFEIHVQVDGESVHKNFVLKDDRMGLRHEVKDISDIDGYITEIFEPPRSEVAQTEMKTEDIYELRKCVVRYMSKHNIHIPNPNPEPYDLNGNGKYVTFDISTLNLRLKEFKISNSYELRALKYGTTQDRLAGARVWGAGFMRQFKDRDGLEDALYEIFQLSPVGQADARNRQAALIEQERFDQKFKVILDNISEEQKDLVKRVVIALKREKMFKTENIPTYVKKITEHFENIVSDSMIDRVSLRANPWARIGQLVAALESRSI